MEAAKIGSIFASSGDFAFESSGNTKRGRIRCMDIKICETRIDNIASVKLTKCGRCNQLPLQRSTRVRVPSLYLHIPILFLLLILVADR